MVSDCILKLQPAGQFKTPYYNTTCVNGTRLMDVNPIFSAQCEKTKNILRVAIHNGVPGLSEIHNDIDGKNELCLITNLDNIEAARTKISKWVKQQLSESKPD